MSYDQSHGTYLILELLEEEPTLDAPEYHEFARDLVLTGPPEHWLGTTLGKAVASCLLACRAQADLLVGLHCGPSWETAGCPWEDRDEARRDLKKLVHIFGGGIGNAACARLWRPAPEEVDSPERVG
jgi:hypothetical protein